MQHSREKGKWGSSPLSDTTSGNSALYPLKRSTSFLILGMSTHHFASDTPPVLTSSCKGL
jgi:hypothetical protein